MKPSTTSSSELHAHRVGDAVHNHIEQGRNPRVLAGSLVLTLSFAGVELVAGLWSNSLALISDAGHMVTDSSALALALLARSIARHPPSPTHSFGFGRAEALAAFVNALTMVLIVGWIAFEAIDRLSNPREVKGEAVILVALIGMVVNLLVAWLLTHDEKSLNTRAAMIHVLGDLLASVAALAAGVVIYFSGWLPIDPLLSLLVSMLILASTLRVLRDSYHFLMEGVPREIDYLQVGADLKAVEGVLSVHDLHIWEMTPGRPALIGHVEIAELRQWPTVLAAIKTMLMERHGIDHITLQAELPGMAAKRSATACSPPARP